MEAESLSEPLRETLTVFNPGEPLTTPEVAAALSFPRRSTYARLERLVEQGRLKTKKVGANARVWWLPPTEPTDRTQALEAERQAVVARLGQHALATRDLDECMAHITCEVVATLDADFGKVLDLHPDEKALVLRHGVGWNDGIVGHATVSATDNNSQAAYTLASDTPVVVEDLSQETRFRGPALLTDHEVTSGISVVIGSVDDPWGILGVHDTKRRTFDESAVNFVQAVANILATAINRQEFGSEMQRQREILATVSELNAIVNEITESVIEQSTRTEIEQVACDALAGASAYEFALIAHADPTTNTLKPHVSANTRGYEADIEVSLDPADPESDGPGARAYREQEIQIVRNVFTDPAFEPWRDVARKYGYSAVASIPIVHEGIVYGVLGVYADRANAFDASERNAIGHLGEVIGHAIAGIQQKRAMTSDEVIELEIRIRDVFEAIDIESAIAGTIRIESVIPLADDDFLVYGSATTEAYEGMLDAVEEIPEWEALSERNREDGEHHFELRLTEEPITVTVASMGGHIERAIIDDGDLQLCIHVAPSSDVRQLIAKITEIHPTAELLRRRQHRRSEEQAEQPNQGILTALTDRQRQVLEAGYHAGFFSWPRDATGEEVAASLGIAPPTFHQHLRKGEEKVFDGLFGDTTTRTAT